jgi:signal transduction histidine kinase
MGTGGIVDAEMDALRADTEAIEAISLGNDEETGPQAVPLERLVCVVGPDMGRTFPVGRKVLVLGRDNVDVVLKSTDVSRRHARISVQKGEHVLEDLGSSNGTYVNGNPVTRPTPVRVGDRIQLGSTILVLSRHDELEERLQQLQKLESMGGLVKGLAHDFNNVLTILLAGLEELGDTAMDDRSRNTLGEMTSAAQSAASLVRRLLQIGRSKPQTSELVALEDLVKETIALSRRLKLDNVKVELDLAPFIMVRGSREQLRHVFLNLILNARDAMPHGGRLTISGAVTKLDRASALAQHLPQEGHYVGITVADTGTGMDEATLRRVFEPFFTTKPVGKGTGLGLAMVFSTVRNHHGSISVASVPGRGTTFSILLPRAG